MNYIEYTNSLLRDINRLNRRVKVLVVGPGYAICGNDYHNIDIVCNKHDQDLAEWAVDYRNQAGEKYRVFKPFDYIIMNRVIEHLPYEDLDFYIYNLSFLLEKDGELIAAVPQMDLIAKELDDELNKDNIDFFKTKMLNIELYGAGEIWDRHCVWTTKNSTKYFLEREGMLSVIGTKEFLLDNDIMPPVIEFTAIRKSFKGIENG